MKIFDESESDIMGGLFNMDNPFWRALGKVADLMILNIIFLITCIPIITIGAATTALNYVALKMHDGEDGYIVRNYFKSFGANFRQATIIWLLTLLAAFVLVSDFLILRDMEGTFGSVMTVLIILVTIICVMVYLYVFAVLARFDNTIKNTIKNSFIMSIADLPRTAIMALTIAAAIVVSIFNEFTLTWAILIWIVIGFALISFCNTHFLSVIFKKYMPKDEEEENPDSWDVDETIEKMEAEKAAEEAAAKGSSPETAEAAGEGAEKDTSQADADNKD